MYVTYLEINIGAIVHNITTIKKYAPHQKLLAMLKGNAYGHGTICVASAITDLVDAFGVMYIEDGMNIRNAGITKPIVLMGGFFSPKELYLISELEFEVVVHEAWQIDVLNSISLTKPISIWLKVNSGLNRLGFSIEQTWERYHLLTRSKNVKPYIRLLTHFSDADDSNGFTTQQQINKFIKFTQNIPCEKSLCNSAGILQWPTAYGDWIRPGLILYGISPMYDKVGKDFHLKPAMTFRSRLIAVREHQKGDRLGYGGTWICPEDKTPIGVVPVGYADGYPRNIATIAPILVNGLLCNIVARVSMHFILVDLRNNLSAKPGDEVILWGEELPIEIVAKHALTIPNELLVKLPITMERLLIQ